MTKEYQKDSLFHALTGDGQVRVIAISGRELVAEAQRIHSLSRVATAALGRQLMMTAMMASEQKGENELVSTIIKGDGPAGSLVCTGSPLLAVKGCVTGGETELPPQKNGKLDVGGFVGHRGKLTVIRDLGLKEPYVGTCNLISGEIAEDFANYYAASLQQPSLVYLGVREDVSAGTVLAAAGLVVQPLPDCPDAIVDALQLRAGEIGKMTERIAGGESLLSAVKTGLGTLELTNLESRTPFYRCDCSRRRIERALISTGREEIEDMIKKDGGAEVTCQFCNRNYQFTAEDLKKLLSEAGEE